MHSCLAWAGWSSSGWAGVTWSAYRGSRPPYQFRYGAVTTQPMQAYEFDAVAVRAACEQDPALGYALLDRFLAVALRRLQATRARLLEARSPALLAGQQ